MITFKYGKQFLALVGALLVPQFAQSQERICPDGMRSYFGVCPQSSVRVPLGSQESLPAPRSRRQSEGAGPPKWLKTGEVGYGNFYVDVNSYQSTGGRTFLVWMMIDFYKPDRDGDRSVQARIEYDCTNRVYKIRQHAYYKDNMGKSLNPSTSAPPAPLTYFNTWNPYLKVVQATLCS